MNKAATLPPLVSIGLPVYNGQNYLEETILSILGQTFTNFELIIFDNASTDDTSLICKKYAQQDTRISYSRNTENVGAAANYDRCFEQAIGHYFKWAAHDDLLTTDYLEKTVQALENDPDAIKCATGIREIDQNGNTIQTYVQQFLKDQELSPSQRFATMIKYRTLCSDFFGLYRRESLIGSQLHGNFVGSDNVLLAEMTLRGRTILLPEYLFLLRQHPERYGKQERLDRDSAANWWDPNGVGLLRNELSQCTRYLNYFRVAHRSGPNFIQRVRCYIYLLSWLRKKRNYRKLSSEISWKLKTIYQGNRPDQSLNPLV